MPHNIPDELLELALSQDGVISRKQALISGISADAIEGLLRAGRWQTIRHGVYLVFTGTPTRTAVLWAAVHRAGVDAVLSHQTAAELFKLNDDPSSLIHITIGNRRRIGPIGGVVIHHSNRLAYAVHPSLQPPRTRLEETVLDLVDSATTFDAAFAVASAACQRRLTTSDRLAYAMSLRTRIRWRSELAEGLGAIDGGTHSVFEYRYVRRVERPHGLPTAVRQARFAEGGRRRYLDNLYRDYGLCVELDGRQAHPDDRRWQDLRRVNAITEQGLTILRYGWTDIARWPCETATQIGTVLRNLGWRGQMRSCNPLCPAGNRPSP